MGEAGTSSPCWRLHLHGCYVGENWQPVTDVFSNRVAEVKRNLLEASQVSSVLPVMFLPGDLNPADVVTRGLGTFEDLVVSSTCPDMMLVPMVPGGLAASQGLRH